MNNQHRSFVFFIISFAFISWLAPATVSFASGTLTVEAVSPGTTVPAGTLFTLNINASGFTNPNFIVEDNFGGTTLSSSDINASGYMTWTPTMNDVGTHAITVTAGDSLGNSASVNQMITVTPATITLSSPSPSATINAGTSVTFMATVAGFSSPNYSIKDTSGGTLPNAMISTSGYFSWIPTAADVGSHTITITAADGQGHSVSSSQNITVNAAPTIAINSLSPGAVVQPGQQITFVVSNAGFTSPTFTVHDSFSPTTIGKSNIDASGNFTWLPGTDAIGTHSLYITVLDGASGYSQSLTQVISVQPLSISIEGLTRTTDPYGTPLYFNVTTSGFSSTTYAVSDSFPGSTATNANLTASGNFSWTPQSSDVGTHLLTFTTGDPAGHVGSTSQQIIVTAPATTTAAVAATAGTPEATITALLAQIKALQAQLAALQAGQTTGVASSASSGDTYKFLVPLSYGSSGAGVIALQKRLTNEGVYSGPVNGNFGPLTRAAVITYQAKHGIDQLGNVGPATRAALNAE